MKEKYNPYNADRDLWNNRLPYLAKYNLLKEKKHFDKLKRKAVIFKGRV